MKRLPAVVGISVFAALISLAAVYATTTGELAPSVKNAQVQEAAQQQPTPTPPVTPGIFVAPGLPVTLAVGAGNSDRGFSEYQCTVNAKAASKITNLHLLLFELSQTGKLLGVESISRAIDLTAKRSDSFPLRARKTIRSGAKLILALETVSGPDGGWQLDLSDAVQAAVAVADNRPAPAVNVAQDQDIRRGDYGSNYCARAFAVATFLGKFSELGGMPSFSCNQQERTYSFAYASTQR